MMMTVTVLLLLLLVVIVVAVIETLPPAKEELIWLDKCERSCSPEPAALRQQHQQPQRPHHVSSSLIVQPGGEGWLQ
jgi:hypothetical protein